METRHLKYFIDVANTLSFTKAAQLNHVVQTTMSQNIVALENQLGFKLFERDNRNVRLTRMGELFYNDAQNILNIVDIAENHVSQLKNGRDGFLQIGYTGEHSMRFMPKLLKLFREENPKVGMDLIQAFPSKLSALLEDGTCDVIFTIAQEPEINEYDEVICDSQDLYLVVNQTHPFVDREEISYSEIIREPMVFFHPSCGNGIYNAMIYSSVKGGYNPNIVGYASDPRSLILMVELGLGLTILPDSCNMGHKGGVKFIKLKDAQKLDIVARWLCSNNNPALHGLVRVLQNTYK